MPLELREDYIKQKEVEQKREAEQMALSSDAVIYSAKFLKHRRYFLFFATLSALGVINLSTAQVFGWGDYLGVITILPPFIFGNLFGVFGLQDLGIMLGSAFSTAIGMILSLVIIWIPIALIERNNMKKVLREANIK